jgi:hypothetical protein
MYHINSSLERRSGNRKDFDTVMQKFIRCKPDNKESTFGSTDARITSTSMLG